MLTLHTQDIPVLAAISGIAARENRGVEILRSTAALPRAVIRVGSTIHSWEFALSHELHWRDYYIGGLNKNEP